MAKSAHFSEEEIRMVARGTSNNAELSLHARDCVRCAGSVAEVRTLTLMTALESHGACPDSEQLVLHAEGRGLSADDRAQLDSHARGCESCAVDLEAMQRALRDAAEPPRSTGRLESLAESVRALVSFDMPLSVATVVRGSQSSSSEFDAGMEAYRSGDYETAERKLRAALDGGEPTAEACFFLGVCVLKDERSDEAVELLSDAVARSSGRLGVYRYYLAQALLSEGRADAGLSELKKSVRVAHPERAAARRLARELESLLATHGQRPSID